MGLSSAAVAAGAALAATTAISAPRSRGRCADHGQGGNNHQKVLHRVPPVELNCFSLMRMSEPTRTNNQGRGGGTGGRSDRDDEAAISPTSFSPRSGEKTKG